jgi:hypothetical protein
VDLIKDWGGFEELVANLNETGTVTVQRDVVLKGKSGAPRQIDVLVTHTVGLYRHIILIECKFWKKQVERIQIDAMAAAVEDLNASRGVFFTSSGYQTGAEIMARAKGIDIFRVRELSDAEWGGPGRVVEIFVQEVSRAIGNLRFPGAYATNLAPEVDACAAGINIALAAGSDGFESITPIANSRFKTLEEILDKSSFDALRKMTAKTVTFNGGAECTVYFMAHMQLPFVSPVHFHQSDYVTIYIPRIEYDAAVRIRQSRFRFDRGDKYVFALAVENCITGVTYAATREQGESISGLKELAPAGESSCAESLKNGSVLRMTLKSFFDFSEVKGLSQVPWPKELEE